MFRDFLPFFFSPLYFFLPLIRAPTPFTDLVLLTRRRGISRQTIFASFFFLPRIKNEKGSWEGEGERIRGSKGRKCAYVDDKRNDKTKKQSAFHTSLELFEKFRNIASYGFYFTIRS